MKEMIKLSNVGKSYKKTEVVSIEELIIEKNSIYGLIGPNGAGKSTTMKMICGLIDPSKGSIKVDGLEMNEKNRIPILKKIGSLIEAPSYYANLSGYDNLDIVKDYKGFTKGDVESALDIVGLQAHKNKKVKEYSLGMKQRLGIAMALMGFPPLLILDEPTNGLDPQVMAEVRDLIRSLPKQFDTTIMISSHALDEIEKMASQIGIIGKGRLLYQGGIKEFKARYKGQIHIRSSNNEKASLILEDLKPKWLAESLVLPYLEDREIPKILEKLAYEGVEVYRIMDQTKSLEELFLDFTRHEHL